MSIFIQQTPESAQPDRNDMVVGDNDSALQLVPQMERIATIEKHNRRERNSSQIREEEEKRERCRDLMN